MSTRKTNYIRHSSRLNSLTLRNSICRLRKSPDIPLDRFGAEISSRKRGSVLLRPFRRRRIRIPPPHRHFPSRPPALRRLVIGRHVRRRLRFSDIQRRHPHSRQHEWVGGLVNSRDVRYGLKCNRYDMIYYTGILPIFDMIQYL